VHVNDKQMINDSKMTGWGGKIEATNLALRVMFWACNQCQLLLGLQKVTIEVQLRKYIEMKKKVDVFASWSQSTHKTWCLNP
jgi:hypothetical protein